MDVDHLFCPNVNCPARGRVGEGNIRCHSEKEKRCVCTVCNHTFSVTKNTIFYRLRTDPKTVMLVITLMAYGCPLQAIVKAFGFDERTVRSWWQRAGQHCQAVHHQLVEQKSLDLQQVQADEIKVKGQGVNFWMALALMVSTRLWLGGEVSLKRDLNLIEALITRVKGMALCRPLVIAVDGLSSYVTAIQRAFRSALPREGRPGRPRLISWPNIAIVQVIKQRHAQGMEIKRQIVQGTQELIATLLDKTQGGGVINTAYIERLNATFRQRLTNLTRRTRSLAHKAETLSAGMYVVGCFYNFCDPHHSLRVKLFVGSRDYRWVERTPALAAGLTDHIWTPQELLTFRVSLPPWTPPKKRGRMSQETRRLIQQWAS